LKGGDESIEVAPGHAWRLAQHGLSPRFEKRDFVRPVTLTGGLQAQVMSAAELALMYRVEDSAQKMSSLPLWQDRTLVKTGPCVALTRLSASELPVLAARGFDDEARTWTNYFASTHLPGATEGLSRGCPARVGRNR